MKALITLLLLLLVVGCASQPAQQLVEQRPTLEIDCPTGCKVSYRDPRDQPARATTGWDAAIAGAHSLERILLGGLPIAGLTYIGAEGFRALAGSGAITTNTNTAHTNTDNSVATDNGVDYSGQTGRIGTSEDYTHVPTVVEQPRPIVVVQPPPVIVPAPEPTP